MKIYAFPPSPNARKVLATAYQLGVPFDLQMVDLTKGEQRAPEYLKLNPNGRMPTLVDGDFVLWESNAIMQYIAAKKPGNTLWPSEPRKQFDVLRWQFWEACHWTPAVGVFLFENMVKQIVGMGAPDAAKLKDGETNFHRHAPVLNQHLAQRRWLTGDTLTIADISVGAALCYAQACRLPLDAYPNIIAWSERLEAVESMQKTAPRAPVAA